MHDHRQTVFLICSRRPIVAEFLMLGEALAREPELRPMVAMMAPGLVEARSGDLPFEVPVIEVPKAVKGPLRTAQLQAFKFWRHFARLLRRVGLVLAADFLETCEGVLRGQWIARWILRIEANTAAVLVADDRDIRTDAGILKYANGLGICTMAVAFGKSDPVFDAYRRRNQAYDLDAEPWKKLKHKIASKYPRSVITQDDGRQLLFLRPGEHLALTLLDALLPTPWAYGGGPARKVAVVDESAAESIRRLGVSDEKILVTGQCSYDVLHELSFKRNAVRDAVVRKYALRPEVPIVILAMPVLGEHGMASHAQQMEEARYLFQTLAHAGVNALVSLHPRQTISDYQGEAARCAISIAREPLRDILPAADVFVAYSTTLAWAQLLQIPSIALEYYGMGFAMFDGQPGITVVRERASLPSTLSALSIGSTLKDRLTTELRSYAARVPFDGGARRRIIAAILSSVHSTKPT